MSVTLNWILGDIVETKINQHIQDMFKIIVTEVWWGNELGKYSRK